MDKDWFVYVLRCVDNSLYTGITTNIERRLKEHNNGKKGAAYTRVRRPLILFYTEGPMNRLEAIQRELAIKKLPKKEKEMLGKC